MKKSIWMLLGAVVVVAIIVAVVVGTKGDDTSTKSSSSTSKSSSAKAASSGNFAEVKACDVLTAAIAQQLAGADASTSDTPSAQASTSSVSVTDCSYYSSSTKNTVSLLSRSALDQAGADTNKGQFTSGLPTDAQTVSGYGDAAYWSPTYGQFNILKHNNWYILSNGPLTPASRTQAQAEQFAKLIVDKL